MAIGIHNLTPSQKKKSRKRVGRGNASGTGTYSGRGIKGQRSRSGGKSGLKRRGLKQYLLQIPKVRGFKRTSTVQSVNLGQLNEKFAEGNHVTPQKLVEKGLIQSGGQVKILNSGTVKKKLTVSAHAFSKTAVESIKKAGGNARVIKRG